jgi:putative GTP pyrophosphokinase
VSQGPILEHYDRVLPILRARGERMRAELSAVLAIAPALKIHSVELRLKSRASLAHKLARPDRDYLGLWDVTDLIGLRVITYFEDAVDRVGELLERHLPVDLGSSIDKRRRDVGAFGYRSLHYVCRLDPGVGPGDGPGDSDGDGDDGLPAHARCEVQVRTVLEHAWAEIEHDLGYKATEAVPAAVRRRLHRLAGLLELADQEFVAIRRDLEEYAGALPRRIETAADGVALDHLSLAALLDCPEVAAADRAIAGELGKQLGDEPFFPDYLLKMLAASGVDTVAQARAGVRARSGTIVAMVRPYFAFTSRAWSLSPEQMPRLFRGYSLFFLAHALVLDSPALGIDKVDRLTRLYRELDYPDDVRAAQRVASTLVDAFRM